MSKKFISQAEIRDGDNRDRLFDSLKYAYDKTVSLPAHFTIDDLQIKDNMVAIGTVEIRLISLEHLGGTGHFFVFVGSYRGYQVDGHYNTQTRKGVIGILG